MRAHTWIGVTDTAEPVVVLAEQVGVDRPDPDALLASEARQSAEVVDRVPGNVQSDAGATPGEPVDQGRVGDALLDGARRSRPRVDVEARSRVAVAPGGSLDLQRAQLSEQAALVHAAQSDASRPDFECAFDFAGFESRACEIDFSRSTVLGSPPSKASRYSRLFRSTSGCSTCSSCWNRAIPFRLRNFRNLFGSEVTVRSDLGELARQGLVARVRGGVRALQQGQSEVGFDLRLRLEVERKRAIARAAAALVGEGEAVALDASTTAYYLALELRSKRELVVVTNGLLVATALADAPGINVSSTAGMLRLSAMSLVGDLGTDVLRDTRINKGFLGARGLSIERGLMDLNPDEVRIKQEMADACERVYGIFDATKWHRSALLSFVAVEELAGIVTDSGAPEAEVETWRAAGVDVITADPGPREPPPVRPRDLRRAVRNDAQVG